MNTALELCDVKSIDIIFDQVKRELLEYAEKDRIEREIAAYTKKKAKRRKEMSHRSNAS